MSTLHDRNFDEFNERSSSDNKYCRHSDEYARQNAAFKNNAKQNNSKPDDPKTLQTMLACKITTKKHKTVKTAAKAAKLSENA
jgi:hypothetical protein